MEQSDLTRLKHIGPSRMKLLRDHGVTTIAELHEIPEKKLAAIKSIGLNKARLIKRSAAEYDANPDRRSRETAPALDENKAEKLNRALQTRIRQLHETLEGLNETLKPLGKKKYLALYIDFKKKSVKLRARLDETDPSLKGLSKKVKKKVLRQADALSALLTRAGQKRKKKRYREVIREMQSFSKTLRDIDSSSDSASHGDGQSE